VHFSYSWHITHSHSVLENNSHFSVINHAVVLPDPLVKAGENSSHCFQLIGSLSVHLFLSLPMEKQNGERLFCTARIVRQIPRCGSQMPALCFDQ
jgi:hypothetical protein